MPYANIIITAIALTALGCAAGGSGDTSGAGSPGPSGGGGDDGLGGTGAGNDGTPPPSVLYVHSNTALYVGDPTMGSMTLSPVGEFDCIGGDGESTAMTDIAVNAAGEVWGISVENVYRLEIQASTVHCADAIALDNPDDIFFYGLTFAPRGVLAPDEEVLIAGNSAGELWSIDAAGQLARRGTLGIVPGDDGHGRTYAHAGQAWELSGDIAFFENDGAPVGFATVRDCEAPPSSLECNEVDTLVELDVPALAESTTEAVLASVRGQVVSRAACSETQTGYGGIYGIAGWLGTVYGFSRSDADGFAIAMEGSDASACLMESFPGIPWAGAGVTTAAPIIPPQ